MSAGAYNYGLGNNGGNANGNGGDAGAGGGDNGAGGGSNSGGGTLADLAPLSLPIGTPEETADFANEHVAFVVRTVQAFSIDYSHPGTVTYTNAVVRHADDGLKKAFGFPFRYVLTNPSDSISGNVWFTDTNGNYLYYGNVQYNTNDIAHGGAECVIDFIGVPILDNVASATLFALNPDGSSAPNQYQQQVNSRGQLIWSSWPSGASNGLLSVTFVDGSAATWKLQKPLKTEPGLVTDNSGGVIRYHYRLEAKPGEKALYSSVFEVWQRPTWYLDNRANGEISNGTIEVAGAVLNNNNGLPYFEHPLSMTISNKVDGHVWVQPLNPNGTTTGIHFPAGGEFRATFGWVNFAPPVELYTGPIYGEKGQAVQIGGQ